LSKRDLEERTKNFALQIINFVSDMPKNRTTNILSNQLLRSGTSIGANYREANRAESRRDFIHKIAIVEKEAAETQYWLELFAEADVADNSEVQRLHAECTELLAIFTAIGKTSKQRG